MDMDAVHWKKVQRVVPWLLPGGRPARARVHRAGRVDDRHHPVDGLHPLRRVRVGLPVARGRPRVRRPGRAGQGLPLRGRPARRPDRGAPARPRRGPARHVRLHPLLRVRRGLPQGRGADEPDHAPAPARHRRLRDQGRRTTATATSRPSCGSSRSGARSTRGRCRVRSFGEGSMVRGPARRRAPCKQLLELGRHRRSTRSRRSGRGRLFMHPKLPDQKQVRRIFKEIESKDERLELNLYIVGEEGERNEARVLARLRLARLHPGAARLDGGGRAASSTSSSSSSTAPTAAAPA